MSHKYSPRDWFILFLKGAGMGAADVVPGVSGGTIAFVTGIYEQLLNAIKSVDLKLPLMDEVYATARQIASGPTKAHL